MSEPKNNLRQGEARFLVQLTVEELRALVSEEIQALGEHKRPKLLFDTKEAAAMLSVPESWLGTKARMGEIPHRMLGHYRYFSMADIETIIAQFAIVPVPVVYSDHDEQSIQANAQGTQDESSPACKSAGSHGNGSGEVGKRGTADLGAGGARNEASARKKIAGGENVGTENDREHVGSQVSSPRAAKAENVSEFPSGGELRRENENSVTGRRLRDTVGLHRQRDRGKVARSAQAEMEDANLSKPQDAQRQI